MKYSEFMNPHPSTGEIISVKIGVTFQKSYNIFFLQNVGLGNFSGNFGKI